MASRARKRQKTGPKKQINQRNSVSGIATDGRTHPQLPDNDDSVGSDKAMFDAGMTSSLLTWTSVTTADASRTTSMVKNDLPPWQSLTDWAETSGIELNGVKPAVLPGRGTGLVTTRKVKKGEQLIHVPITGMLGYDALMSPVSKVAKGKSTTTTAENTNLKRPQKAAKEANGLSPQAQLAVKLGEMRKAGHETYTACCPSWPTPSDFEKCMLWYPLRRADAAAEALRKLDTLLPESVSKPLERLKSDLANDIKAAGILPNPNSLWDMGKDVEVGDSEVMEFVYHWALANSRSFAWKPEGRGVGGMVMCPGLDFVNHCAFGSGEACFVGQSEDGYSLKANRNYTPGEEIYASYGAHTNDKLLVHYGFTLPDSADDAIYLDPVLIPLITESQSSTLRDVGYMGNYTLTPSTNELCFRTQVAVRSVLHSSNEWEYFMGSGEDIADDKVREVRGWLEGSVGEYGRLAHRTAHELTVMLEKITDDAVRSRIELVRDRWKQIETGLQGWLDSEN